LNAGAEFERDLATVFRKLPRVRKFWFERLRLPVHAHQDATRQVADGEGGVVIHLERIESFGFGSQTEAQFVAVLG